MSAALYLFIFSIVWPISPISRPVRIHVPYTAHDVISINGQGQLCRGKEICQSEHDLVKETAEKPRKP